MKYQPNIKDPRVLKRMKQAYGFTKGFVPETKSRAIAQTLLIKHFGYVSSDVTQWLRDILLITTSQKYNKDAGVCKEYTQNPSGVRYVRDVLRGITSKSFDEYSDEHSLSEMGKPSLHTIAVHISTRKQNSKQISHMIYM